MSFQLLVLFQVLSQCSITAKSIEVNLEKYLLIDNAEGVENHLSPFSDQLEGTALSLSYIRSVFHSQINYLQPYIVAVVENARLEGIIMFQKVLFSGKNSFNLSETGVKNFLKKSVGNHIDFNTLILGNVMRSGKKGFKFFDDNLNPGQIVCILNTALELVLKNIPEKERAIELIVVKDIDKSIKDAWPAKCMVKFHPFEVEPDLVMTIPAGWKGFSDYLDSLTAKYKIRAKRTLGFIRDLIVEEIADFRKVEELSPLFHQLYLKIVSRSDFNLVTAGEDYIGNLKRMLGDKFKVFTLSKETGIVAFFTLIEYKKNIWEAHYLGYNEQINKEYRLYHNILFLLIEKVIEFGGTRLDFGRTAFEIKTSVGAVPVQYWNLMTLRNKWINPVVPHMIQLMNTKNTYIQRHPFKKDVEVSV